MRSRRLRLIGPFTFLAVILLNYSNCSSSKMTYDENYQKSSNSSAGLGDVCSQSELDLFSLGYHSFLKTNCTSCHFSGPGKGTFAHPDANLAFASFQSLGVDKISSMAVSDSHNFPYTGGHHLEAVNNLKSQWKTYQIEKANCKTPGSTPTDDPTTSRSFNPQFMTNKKTFPAIKGTPSRITVNGSAIDVITYNSTVVTFNLDQDLLAMTEKPVPSTGGASLSIVISGYSNPSGATGYLIQMPKLKAGSSSLNLNGLHVLMNGRPVGYSYTFQRVDTSVYKQNEVMISGGSMLVLGPMEEGDQISLSIGDLKIVEMSEPPPPPKVQFDASAVTIAESQLGYATPYKLGVSLVGDNSSPVSVTISRTGNEAQANVAKGLLDASGRSRFNWDYRFNSSLNVTFLPGETKKYVEIIFSDDLRDDVTKTLTLNLTDPFGGSLGTQSSVVITLPDYNPAPDGSITFAQLMNPGGILEMNCVRCHNSLDRQGGYDMTDYQEMVNKGVIIPGNLTPNNHKMYRRMNPDAPNAGTITPMPLDGFLTQDLTLIVESWIRSGAKNN